MWSALRVRRGQTVVVTLVALLATASLAFAPWYATKAVQEIGVAAVAGAPVDDRLVAISWRPTWPADQSASPELLAEAQRQFHPAGFTTVVGGFMSGDLHHPRVSDLSVDVSLAYREGVCDHLVVQGKCPSAPGEVVLPVSLMTEFPLKPGDEMVVTVGSDTPLRVRVVGFYRVSDPAEPYWGDGSLVDTSADQVTAFTARSILQEASRITYTYDLVAQPQAFATADLERLSTTLSTRLSRLRADGYSASATELEELLARIMRDRQTVTTGVGVGVVVLVLLTWFALAVVIRETVVQARRDVGWWRLHGAPSFRGWLLVLGQSAIPLVCGALVGTAIGLVAGRAVVGTIEGGGAHDALVLCLLLVGLALVGGLVTVVAAQLSTLITPVGELLRRMPVRRAGWRRSLVDLVLVALATYGVAQALLVGSGVGGLPLLAPTLAALAIALVAAWAVPPFAAWVAARARRSGRLATALVAAVVARRPETHRLFALVVVAVALVATAFVGWDTAARMQWQRAALEVGGHRVITVDAEDAAQLLAGVRAVDPDGTQAMAVVEQPVGDDVTSEVDVPTLAVDSTRLALVAGWRDEYGGDVEAVAAALRPTDPRSVVLRSNRISLRAAGTDPAGTSVSLRIRLRVQASGKPVDVVVGPLTDELRSYTTDISSCSAGCRLVGVQVLGPAQRSEGGASASDPDAVGHLPASPGTQVVIAADEEAERGSTIPAAVLAEPTRWRPGLGPRDLGPGISAGEDGLHLRVSEVPDDAPVDRSDWAFVVDVPAPLPVIVAGWRPDPSEELRIPPLPGAAVPSEVVRRARLMPRGGKSGTLVDLTYAERLVPFPITEGERYEVWLSPTASPSIVAELREVGLTPLREESIPERVDQLAAQGSAVAVRFQTAVALVGLALATGAVLMDAARERPARAAELAALHAQGLGLKVVRVVGYGGFAAIVGTAVVVGLGAGLVGAGIARVLYPGFVDGWNVVPTIAIQPHPVATAAAVTVVALGSAVAAAGAALMSLARARS